MTGTDEQRVIEGRDRYLAANGLSIQSYTAKRFPIYVGRWAVWLPNPGFLPRHDLHHVITGYSTGLIGEAEISAYELRGGCGSVMIFILCVGAIFFAMFLAPARVRNAWRKSKATRNLYRDTTPYEVLLDMKIGDLREQLGLPRAGLVRNE